MPRDHDVMEYPNWPVEICASCRLVAGDHPAVDGFEKEMTERFGKEYADSWMRVSFDFLRSHQLK